MDEDSKQQEQDPEQEKLHEEMQKALQKQVDALEEKKEESAHEKTAREMEEARAGRQLGDIPPHDNYWNLANLHRATNQ